jgi:hypothetical protein
MPGDRLSRLADSAMTVLSRVRLVKRRSAPGAVRRDGDRQLPILLRPRGRGTRRCFRVREPPAWVQVPGPAAGPLHHGSRHGHVAVGVQEIGEDVMAPSCEEVVLVGEPLARPEPELAEADLAGVAAPRLPSPARTTAAPRPCRDGRRPRRRMTARTRRCPRPTTRGSRSPGTRCAPASASPTRPPPACCASSAAKASPRSLPRRMTGQDGTEPARPAESKRRACRQAGRVQGLRPDASPSPLPWSRTCCLLGPRRARAQVTASFPASRAPALARPEFRAQRAWFAGLPPPSPSGVVLTAERESAVRARVPSGSGHETGTYPGRNATVGRNPPLLVSRQPGPPLVQGGEPRAQVPGR